MQVRNLARLRELSSRFRLILQNGVEACRHSVIILITLTSNIFVVRALSTKFYDNRPWTRFGQFSITLFPKQ